MVFLNIHKNIAIRVHQETPYLYSVILIRHLGLRRFFVKSLGNIYFYILCCFKDMFAKKTPTFLSKSPYEIPRIHLSPGHHRLWRRCGGPFLAVCPGFAEGYTAADGRSGYGDAQWRNTSVCHDIERNYLGTWMSQEVSKWLVNGL